MTAGFPAYEPYAKSLTSTLSAAGLSVEVVGCGLCGLTGVEMAQGLDAQQLRDNFGRVGPGLRRLLAEQGPFDLVLVMAGTNDLGVSNSSEEVVACLQEMHKACWATGTPSVVLSIPESSVTGTAQYPDAAAKWHAINKALANWGQAAQSENPSSSPFFVNTSELVSFDHTTCMRGLWDPDGLHFTAAGSREFGSKLAPLIASHLQGQTQHADTNASVHRQLTPERTPATMRTDHVHSLDSNCSAQSLSRIDHVNSLDRNCSSQSLSRMHVPVSGIPPPRCGPPANYMNHQTRIAVY